MGSAKTYQLKPTALVPNSPRPLIQATGRPRVRMGDGVAMAKFMSNAVELRER